MFKDLTIPSFGLAGLAIAEHQLDILGARSIVACLRNRVGLTLADLCITLPAQTHTCVQSHEKCVLAVDGLGAVSFIGVDVGSLEDSTQPRSRDLRMYVLSTDPRTSRCLHRDAR